MKLPVSVLCLLGGLLMMTMAVVIIDRGWRFGIATNHVLLLEVLFYFAGYVVAKVGWVPLRQGLRGLWLIVKPPASVRQ